MYQKHLPNTLTLLRVGIIPVLVASFYMENNLSHLVAAGLFVLASVTDFFDGYLARAWKIQSKFGMFLDPIADKMLVITAIVMLVAFDRIGEWNVIPALLIICREILVSGLREFLAGVNVSLPVSRLAKIKTGVQMAAIFLLILGTDGKAEAWTEALGNTALWAAALLTLATGYAYLKASLRHMSESVSTTPAP